MSRFLSMQRSIVPLSDREDFLKRIRERTAYFRSASCRYWTFEEVGLAGAVIEFIEAEDEGVLRHALLGAPGSPGTHARIYRELEVD